MVFKKYADYWLLLLLLLALKLALLGYIAAVIHFYDLSERGIGVVESLTHWDARAYLTIAAEGYDTESVKPDYRMFLSHFPPVYPLLINAVVFLTPLTLLNAAFFISFLTGIIASILLFELVLYDFKSRRTAFLSVLFFNLYPVAFFQVAPYAESLFLLLLIGSFSLLRHGNQNAAGILGGLAILTRLPGISLMPVYFWNAYSKWNNRKPWFLFFPLMAVFIYLLINRYYYGDLLFFLQEYDQNPRSAKEFIFPFQEVFRDLYLFIIRALEGTLTLRFMTHQGFNALFVLFALGVAICGLRKKIPLEYSIYAFSTLLFIVSFAAGISNARYTLAIFPLFIILASIRNPFLLAFFFTLFSGLLLWFTKIFVTGGWAF